MYKRQAKINYAIYGDLVSHFHVHVVPKQRDGLQWGGPFTDTLPKVTLGEGEFREMGRAILKAMADIAREKGISAGTALM